MRTPLTRQFNDLGNLVQTGFVLISLLFLLAFIYILVMFSLKLLGVVLLLAGLWMGLYFPWQADYQREAFTITSMIIGLVLAIAGALLLWFG
jgi:hypothetical protein